MQKKKKTLSLNEAADFLGISPGSVRKLAKEGKLPYYQPIKALKFIEKDLENFKESRTFGLQNG